MRWRSILDLAASAATVLVAAMVAWVYLLRPAGSPAGQRAMAIPRVPISIEDAAFKGDRNARVALIEYSAFQCPFCARFARETLPVLNQDYIVPGRVLLAFRHVPIAGHPFAFRAAESAECAGRQGRFWDMHDELFAHQAHLDEASLLEWARDIRIDVARFGECLGGKTADSVRRDSANAEGLGIASTPTFLVGIIEQGDQVRVSRMFSGAQPYQAFKSALDSVLAESRTGK